MSQLLVDDGAPLPVWLKDRRFLNPLLAAYDDKIADLQDAASQRGVAIARLQQQVGSWGRRGPGKQDLRINPDPRK